MTGNLIGFDFPQDSRLALGHESPGNLFEGTVGLEKNRNISRRPSEPEKSKNNGTANSGEILGASTIDLIPLQVFKESFLANQSAGNSRFGTPRLLIV